MFGNFAAKSVVTNMVPTVPTFTSANALLARAALPAFRRGGDAQMSPRREAANSSERKTERPVSLNVKGACRNNVHPKEHVEANCGTQFGAVDRKRVHKNHYLLLSRLCLRLPLMLLEGDHKGGMEQISIVIRHSLADALKFVRWAPVSTKARNSGGIGITTVAACVCCLASATASTIPTSKNS
jgi:hypothetical protein